MSFQGFYNIPEVAEFYLKVDCDVIDTYCKPRTKKNKTRGI